MKRRQNLSIIMKTCPFARVMIKAKTKVLPPSSTGVKPNYSLNIFMYALYRPSQLNNNTDTNVVQNCAKMKGHTFLAFSPNLSKFVTENHFLMDNLI